MTKTDLRETKIQEAIEYFIKRTLDDHGYPINKEHCETALKALYKANKISPIQYDKHYFKCPCCRKDFCTEHMVFVIHSKCPCGREDVGINEDDISVYDEVPPQYCPNCGQALDWSAYQSVEGSTQGKPDL